MAAGGIWKFGISSSYTRQAKIRFIQSWIRAVLADVMLDEGRR
jgi:hypothetical protein